MFDKIETFTLEEFLAEFPDAFVPDPVLNDSSYFVRVGHVADAGTILIEFSPDNENWNLVK